MHHLIIVEPQKNEVVGELYSSETSRGPFGGIIHNTHTNTTYIAIATSDEGIIQINLEVFLDEIKNTVKAMGVTNLNI